MLLIFESFFCDKSCMYDKLNSITSPVRSVSHEYFIWMQHTKMHNSLCYISTLFISAFGWCQRYFNSLRGLLIFGLKQSSAVLFAVVYCICGSVWLRTIDDCSILWFYYSHEWCINWRYQCILSHNFNFLKHSENADREKGIMSFSWEVDAAMLVIFFLSSVSSYKGIGWKKGVGWDEFLIYWLELMIMMMRATQQPQQQRVSELTGIIH